MWLEAVFSREDLQSLLSELVPLDIRLGHDEDLHIRLTDAQDVSLVAATGMRIRCRGVVHWPVAGVHVPVRLESLTVMLKPVVNRTEHGDTLAFQLEIEDADFSGIPSLVDEGITSTLNRELRKRHIELSWNFGSTLSHVFDLPPSLQPLDGVDLRVRWGKVRVTEEAMVMAVSFHPKVLRHNEIAPLRHGPLSRPVAVAAWTGLALGAFFGARAIKHAWA